MMNTYLEKLRQLWHELYDGEEEKLTTFLEELQGLKRTHFSTEREIDTTWYKDAVVYSTYVNRFNEDFTGLQAKLPYLQNLGVTCLWLLPILESPMKDAGFDISNFEAIRTELLGLPADAPDEEKTRVFDEFLQEAHKRGIRLIFDIAINHTSNEHAWFLEARQSKDSPKRDYYIWSDTPERFSEARILMKGILESNWTRDDATGEYYFHRFYDIQPDLNYRNPDVLIEMTRMLAGWKIKGVDGIRADAVPFLWKEDGTDCENLPRTHTVVKFFRAAFEYLEPGTLLLAEACQPPKEVVTYLGDGDECHAAYHFPVMPRIFRVMAEGRHDAVEMVLDPAFTPHIPEECQWFVFLRCHDELSLEMVTPEERTFLFKYYTKDPRWNYREGEGISARLATLFGEDPAKIQLAYSIMFTLPGTPIIYYGDEFGAVNDEEAYQEAIERTGYVDSRNFVRGKIDWERIEQELEQPGTLAYQLYHSLQSMIRVRKQHPTFSWGTIEFIHFRNAEDEVNHHILAYFRRFNNASRLVIQNVSSEEQHVSLPQVVAPFFSVAGKDEQEFYSSDETKKEKDLLMQKLITRDSTLILPPYSFYWL